METTLEQIKAAHITLAEMNYEIKPVVRGYANRTLYVDLTHQRIAARPVTQKMKDIFTGGKGFGLWLLWNGVNETTRWNDPENELVLSCGVIGGITAYPGAGKTIAGTISGKEINRDSQISGERNGKSLQYLVFKLVEFPGKLNHSG